MCGIAGKLNFRSEEPAGTEELRRMCSVLRHRGPDDEGLFVEGPLAMGMRRLSIIDLSTGRQPIHNEDESVWVVYNGEIYNFPELRPTLEAKGHRFYTNTDTEVIVHLYEEHGEGFVDHLAGMFGIALWDRRERKLVLARDRLGIKPLYYHLGADRLVFGSELKAILEDGVDREVDLQAMHDYLSLNYVPGPRSIFRAIRKLPPAHLLVCRNGQTRLRRYWEPPCATGAPTSTRSEGALAEELEHLLRSTVREHLLSDVPLGVFLSGGVDSGALVALASEVSGGRVKTFSIGFEDPSYDELADARSVARRYGTDHHEMVVRPDAASLLPMLVRSFDEPFADSSAVPVYCVSRLAREHVKVVLSGEGGDEVFAGYETYAAYKVAELYKRLPGVLSRRLIPGVVRRLPVSHRRVSFDYKAKRFVTGALMPPAEGHFWWKVIFSEEAKAELYANGRNGFRNPVEAWREAFDRCRSSEPLSRLQHVDLEIYLPDDILVKADRMSMANSLEARVPYLDHRVVEFAATLPASLKVRGLTKKYLLRKTMASRLPANIVKGRKRGFNVPVPEWICGELRETVHDVLSARRIREAGFFDPAVVERLIRTHESRGADLSRNVWGLLMFSLWHDEYARRSPRTAAESGVPRVA
jgi:asparagine synthase (glutamine-hydrolysing)